MIILTHSDFDGISAGIIGKVVYPNAKVEYCNYDDINEKVLKYLGKNTIMITDISVNEEVAEKIEKNNSEYNDCVLLFDHHKTAKWLTKYNWVIFADDKCGTKVFYEWLLDYYMKIDLHDKVERLAKYVDLVTYTNDYDLWFHKYPMSKKLNLLAYEYGFDRFMDRFLDNPDCTLTNTEELILELAEERKIKFIEKQKENMKLYKDNQGKTVAVFLSTQHAGEVRDFINDDNIDYYLFFSLASGIASLRTKGEVDCSEIAKQFLGGGHAKAAGFQFKFDLDSFVKEFNLVERL